MKNQALFPSKDKSKKLKCLLPQFFGALTVKFNQFRHDTRVFLKVIALTTSRIAETTKRSREILAGSTLAHHGLGWSRLIYV